MELLMDKFLDQLSPIRKLIEQITSKQVLLQDEPFELSYKIHLAKSILKLLKEITLNRDGRVNFSTLRHRPDHLSIFAMKGCYSCMGLLREMN